MEQELAWLLLGVGGVILGAGIAVPRGSASPSALEIIIALVYLIASHQKAQKCVYVNI